MLNAVQVIEYVRDIPNVIKLNNKVIKTLENIYYLPKMTASFEDMTHSPSNIAKPTENIALNIPTSITETIERLKKKNKRLDTLFKEILKEIEELEYREHKTIYDFYFLNYRWEKIARGFYSVRQCKNIRNLALTKLEKKFVQNIFIYNFFTF